MPFKPRGGELAGRFNTARVKSNANDRINPGNIEKSGPRGGGVTKSKPQSGKRENMHGTLGFSRPSGGVAPKQPMEDVPLKKTGSQGIDMGDFRNYMKSAYNIDVKVERDPNQQYDSQGPISPMSSFPEGEVYSTQGQGDIGNAGTPKEEEKKEPSESNVKSALKNTLICAGLFGLVANPISLSIGERFMHGVYTDKKFTFGSTIFVVVIFIILFIILKVMQSMGVV